MPSKAIKEICSLYSGFPLSTKDFVEDGNAQVILGANISRYPASVVGDDENISVESSHNGFSLLNDKKGKISNKFFKEVKIKKLTNEKTLHVGDVIFRSRGYPMDRLIAYTPFPLQSSLWANEKPFIISNVFILLRPKSEILPLYLEWAINNFRNEFNQHHSRGISMYTISINQLKEVVLPVPSIKVQKNILLAFDEIEKSKAIAEAKEYLETEMLRGIAMKHSEKE